MTVARRARRRRPGPIAWRHRPSSRRRSTRERDTGIDRGLALSLRPAARFIYFAARRREARTLPVMRWTPEDLARAAGGRVLRRGSREVVGAFFDSRTPLSGGLFVPIV